MRPTSLTSVVCLFCQPRRLLTVLRSSPLEDSQAPLRCMTAATTGLELEGRACNQSSPFFGEARDQPSPKRSPEETRDAPVNFVSLSSDLSKSTHTHSSPGRLYLGAGATLQSDLDVEQPTRSFYTFATAILFLSGIYVSTNPHDSFDLTLSKMRNRLMHAYNGNIRGGKKGKAAPVVVVEEVKTPAPAPQKKERKRRAAPPPRVASLVIPRRPGKIVGHGDYKQVAEGIGSKIGGWVGGKLHDLVARIFGSGDYDVAQDSGDLKQNSFKAADSAPTFRSATEAGGIRIRNEEYLGFRPVTTAFTVQTIAIDCSSSYTFPWAHKIARQYQYYKIHGMLVAVKSNMSVYTTASTYGTYFGSARYNVDEPPPTSKQVVMNSLFSANSKTTKNMLFAIECAPSQGSVVAYKVRHPGTSIGDEQFYRLGLFDLCCEGAPADAAKGLEITIIYDIEFFKPRQDPSVGGQTLFADLAWSDNTQPLKLIPSTALVPQPRLNTAGIVLQPTGVITFPYDTAPGTYFRITIGFNVGAAPPSSALFFGSYTYTINRPFYRNQAGTAIYAAASTAGVAGTDNAMVLVIQILSGASVQNPPSVKVGYSGAVTSNLGAIWIDEVDPRICSGLTATPPLVVSRNQFIDHLEYVGHRRGERAAFVKGLDFQTTRLVDYVTAFTKEPTVDVSCVQRGLEVDDIGLQQALDRMALLRLPEPDGGEDEEFFGAGGVPDDEDDSVNFWPKQTCSIGEVMDEMNRRSVAGWVAPKYGPIEVVGGFMLPVPSVADGLPLTLKSVWRLACRAITGCVCDCGKGDCPGKRAQRRGLHLGVNHCTTLNGAQGEFTGPCDVQPLLFAACSDKPCLRLNHHHRYKVPRKGADRRKEEKKAVEAKVPSPPKFFLCTDAFCLNPFHFHPNNRNDMMDDPSMAGRIEACLGDAKSLGNLFREYVSEKGWLYGEEELLSDLEKEFAEPNVVVPNYGVDVPPMDSDSDDDEPVVRRHAHEPKLHKIPKLNRCDRVAAKQIEGPSPFVANPILHPLPGLLASPKPPVEASTTESKTNLPSTGRGTSLSVPRPTADWTASITTTSVAPVTTNQVTPSLVRTSSSPLPVFQSPPRAIASLSTPPGHRPSASTKSPPPTVSRVAPAPAVPRDRSATGVEATFSPLVGEGKQSCSPNTLAPVLGLCPADLYVDDDDIAGLDGREGFLYGNVVCTQCAYPLPLDRSVMPSCPHFVCVDCFGGRISSKSACPLCFASPRDYCWSWGDGGDTEPDFDIYDGLRNDDNTHFRALFLEGHVRRPCLYLSEDEAPVVFGPYLDDPPPFPDDFFDSLVVRRRRQRQLIAVAGWEAARRRRLDPEPQCEEFELPDDFWLQDQTPRQVVAEAVRQRMQQERGEELARLRLAVRRVQGGVLRHPVDNTIVLRMQAIAGPAPTFRGRQVPAVIGDRAPPAPLFDTGPFSEPSQSVTLFRQVGRGVSLSWRARTLDAIKSALPFVHRVDDFKTGGIVGPILMPCEEELTTTAGRAWVLSVFAPDYNSRQIFSTMESTRLVSYLASLYDSYTTGRVFPEMFEALKSCGSEELRSLNSRFPVQLEEEKLVGVKSFFAALHRAANGLPCRERLHRADATTFFNTIAYYAQERCIETIRTIMATPVSKGLAFRVGAPSSKRQMDGARTGLARLIAR